LLTAKPMHPRSSGILLHPTSLPGKHGIGDFGTAAYKFVDLLANLKQSLWQVLPLCPVADGYSPYQSPSAFAGNPLLISLALLQDEGYLLLEELGNIPDFSLDFLNFAEVEIWKTGRLRQAFQNFENNATELQINNFDHWCISQAFWLDDFATFASMKIISGGLIWSEWPEKWRLRESEEIQLFREKHALEISFHKFVQWQFFKQWSSLRKYANQQGIKIIGDLPIFVAYDSTEVWANPELFELDENQQLSAVAGVPPDYFSETGQHWGNPLYRWNEMRKDGYSWWKNRLRFSLEQFDIVRIDHFRGFENYWEIPSSAATAAEGKWKEGPGFAFFEEMKKELGDLPIIAEDLGLITTDVNVLREKCGFPGMKVLQFAFSDENNSYLPHNYKSSNTVVYTGTHDNNTTLGWYRELGDMERERLRAYLNKDVKEDSVCYDLIKLAWSSNADIALAPLQDLLNLGGECRMNLPGTAGGKNWVWRCRTEPMNDLKLHWIFQLTEKYGRNQ